jgi:hypothetical protein
VLAHILIAQEKDGVASVSGIIWRTTNCRLVVFQKKWKKPLIVRSEDSLKKINKSYEQKDSNRYIRRYFARRSSLFGI